MSSGTHFVTTRSEAVPVQTWTFAGTWANRIFARLASSGSRKVRFDTLSVQAPIAALHAVLPESLALRDDELTSFRGSINFADCVSQQLLTKTITTRNFLLC